jgi:two-component system response regulator MprA
MRILIVDDDRAVRDSLRRALVVHGFEVDVAADGLAAIKHVHDDPPDAAVLDIGMPGVDGFAVTRRLRSEGIDIPILILTARGAVPDRVTGLDAGADDYLAKPFALEELVARLRALLRRTAETTNGSERLVYGDLTLDETTFSARRGDRRIDLTRTEFELLHLFMRNAERVLTRDVILEQVWGHSSSGSNTLEVYVRYLRVKLEAATEPRLIHTVRGFGYMLRS